MSVILLTLRIKFSQPRGEWHVSVSYTLLEIFADNAQVKYMEWIQKPNSWGGAIGKSGK